MDIPLGMAPNKRQKKGTGDPPLDAGKPDAEESAVPVAMTGGPIQGVDFNISRREGTSREPPTPGDIAIRVANTPIECLFLRETGTLYTRTTRADCICNSISDCIATTRQSQGTADANPSEDTNTRVICRVVQREAACSSSCCKTYVSTPAHPEMR